MGWLFGVPAPMVRITRSDSSMALRAFWIVSNRSTLSLKPRDCERNSEYAAPARPTAMVMAISSSMMLKPAVDRRRRAASREVGIMGSR